MSDDADEVIHRDLARGLSAALLAASIGAAIEVEAFLPPSVTLAGRAAHALGWGLGVAAAWTAGAATMRRRGVVTGLVAAALLTPLSGLGAEYGQALLATRDVAMATDQVVTGTRAPTVLALALRALAGLLVLGPVLALRRRGAGLTWQLAGALLGGLALSAVMGELWLHRVVAIPDEDTTVFAARTVATLGAFVIALRFVDVLARRRSSRLPPARRRRGAAGGVVLGAAVLGWVAVAADDPALRRDVGETALRLLPWPRDGDTLARLADERLLYEDDLLGPPLRLGPTARRDWEVGLSIPDTLAVLRRSAALGSIPGMRLTARFLLRLLQRTASRTRYGALIGRDDDEHAILELDTPIEQAMRVEAIGWLRAVATRSGEPQDLRALATWLDRPAEQVEALAALERAARAESAGSAAR